MLRIKYHSWHPGLALVIGSAVLSGCQGAPQAAYAPDYSQYDPALNPARQARSAAPSASYDPADIAPAAGPTDDDPRLPVAAPPRRQPAPLAEAQPYAAAPANGAMAADLMKMQERLERVERAMLRLDRRMQLVERNELNRMGGDAPAATTTPRTAYNLDDSPAAPPAAADDTLPPALTANNGPTYQDGFQPVSTAITSSLQAAPAPGHAIYEPQLADRSVASLPSLADSAGSTGSVKQAGDLAIWTIRYDADKVWPERDQLPASRDVVSLLRDKHAVTLFARGNKPNSVEFRERVKALSRYLAKVTSLESVPIAALAAPHLDDETIEIFAAP